MGYTATEAVETADKGGLGSKILRSVIEAARGRLSMGRVVGYDGCDGLAGVDDTFNPCDFATPETLAFTRMTGLVEGFSGARRAEGDNGGVGWNEAAPLRRAPVREGSSVEVNERCLDNSCGAREAFGLEN